MLPRPGVLVLAALVAVAVAGVRPRLAVAVTRDAVTRDAMAPAADSVAHDSLRRLVDRALLTSALPDYDRALALLRAGRTRTPDDPVLAHYLGFLLYRKANVLATITPGDQEAKRLFEEAGRVLVAAESLGWGETPALRSAIVGQLVGYAGPLGAMRMGPRSLGLMDEATRQAPENPRVLLLRGVSFLYRPRLFGGGADKAERDLRRAIARFASDTPTPPAPWWGRAEAHGWLGEALARQGKVAEARAEFARALELEPGNVWVREVLLPALERKR